MTNIFIKAINASQETPLHRVLGGYTNFLIFDQFGNNRED